MFLRDPVVSFSDTLAKAVLSTTSDAIIAADKEGIIRFWNPGAERIFGYARDAAIGQSLDIIIPERLRKRHWDGYHHVIKSGERDPQAVRLAARRLRGCYAEDVESSANTFAQQLEELGAGRTGAETDVHRRPDQVQGSGSGLTFVRVHVHHGSEQGCRKRVLLASFSLPGQSKSACCREGRADL